MAVTTCKACSAAIEFVRTEKGSMMPVSKATGLSHFLDCPKANEFSGKNRGKKKAQCIGCGRTEDELHTDDCSHINGRAL